MENPWLRLPPRKPYVLDADRLIVEQHNDRIEAPEKKFRLDLLPDPFIGDPNAPVVLLSMNPGFDPDDAKIHASPDFRRAIHRNLAHERTAFPFYYLDPAFKSSPGAKWWNRRLRHVIDACGLETVAAGVFCAELLPYHSEGSPGWRVVFRQLPSLQYTAQLVRDALARDAIVVGMRSKTKWLEMVPELSAYDRTYWLRGHKTDRVPRNANISPQTLPANAFDFVVQAVC